MTREQRRLIAKLKRQGCTVVPDPHSQGYLVNRGTEAGLLFLGRESLATHGWIAQEVKAIMETASK